MPETSHVSTPAGWLVGWRSRLLQGVAPSVLAVILSMLVGALAIMVAGKSPLAAFPAIFRGAFGSRYAISEVLVKATPLLLVGLGTAFAFRCQMWNIGGEGQMLMGAVAASCVALAVPGLPGSAIIVLALAAAFAAGGAWAAIAGFLKARLGTSEIINTIMLNYVAIYLVNWLVRDPLKDTASYVPQSPVFSVQAWLPQILAQTRVHAGIFLAIAAALVVYVLLWHTSLGFSIIAVGSSLKAARASGIAVASTMVTAMFTSGGLAGLAGAGEVLGLHHRLLDGVSAGYGFSAMAVAILGNLHPAGVALFSFLFAALRVGADAMQRQMGVPAAVVRLIEGTVIIFLQGRYLLPALLSRLRRRTSSREAGVTESSNVGDSL